LEMRFVHVEAIQTWVSVFETRVRDYEAFVAAQDLESESPEFDQEPDHPAVNVSWRDAVAFCEWLSATEGLTYRLPTDREWSVLAGIGDKEDPSLQAKDQPELEGDHPWAETGPQAVPGNYCDEAFGRRYGEDYEAAWFEFDDEHAETAPVGSFPALANGLYDVGGNVWEWVDGWYDPDTQRFRIVRGGSWRSGPTKRVFTSFRGPDPPSARLDSVGFRVVLERPTDKEP
jgi:formylglycine-generating enzyme required for sulfatase activity